MRYSETERYSLIMTRVILGGGLSGLSAAYYLLKKFPNDKITLIEGSQRIGGWIRSNSVDNSNIIFEQGARTIRPKGEAGRNTLELIEELGISSQIVPISASHPAAKNRMIYAKGKLHMLPSSITGLFTTNEPFTKPLIVQLLNDIKSPKKSLKDESIYNFIKRRFSDEIADYLISPLICGICAGNAKEISVNFLLKQLFEYEQQYGSITRGMIQNIFKGSGMNKVIKGLPLRAKQEKWNVYSFKSGCETLPKALKSKLLNDGVRISLNTRCQDIILEKDKVILFLNHNESVVADHIICAIPAPSLGLLLEEQHPQLTDLLKQIKSVSVGVVNLYFDKLLLDTEGFGFLVAPKEELPILGVIYDSCCFPWTNSGTVLTVMMGGAWFEKYFGNSPNEDLLLETALSQLKNILNIHDAPLQYKVNILHQCIPQYAVGHRERLQQIDSYIKERKMPISICGSSYDGVGLNDVILSAKNAVNQIIVH